jgi:hypothetical protein
MDQSEDDDFFSGRGADVVVHAHHFGAGDFLDHGFHDRPGRFNQMGPNLFEQVSPFLGGERFDQVLFGGRQNTLKADHQEDVDQVRVDVLGSPAHVILFKATDSFANRGFNLSLSFHSNAYHHTIRRATLHLG